MFLFAPSLTIIYRTFYLERNGKSRELEVAEVTTLLGNETRFCGPESRFKEPLFMTWLRVSVSRLIGLFRKARLEWELDEEVRSHLVMLVEENVRKGMSPKEARYAARRSFGGVEQVK